MRSLKRNGRHASATLATTTTSATECCARGAPSAAWPGVGTARRVTTAQAIGEKGQEDGGGQAATGQADEEWREDDEDREADRPGDPFRAAPAEQQHRRAADRDRGDDDQEGAEERAEHQGRAPGGGWLARGSRLTESPFSSDGARSGRSPHAAGSSGSLDLEDAHWAVTQDDVGARIGARPEPFLRVREPLRQERVVHRHDVVVAACVDLLAPGLAVRDPQERVVLALDPEPLDVVREVRAGERVLVEDAAHARDRDPRVADVLRPARSLGDVQVGAQVLVAALEVVALHQEARDDGPENDHHPDRQVPPRRRRGAEPAARAEPDRGGEQGEDERAHRDPALRVAALRPLHDRQRRHQRESAEPDQGERPPPLARPLHREARQDRERDRHRGHEIADVPLERDRVALLPTGGERREDVGDSREQRDGAERPQDRLATLPDGVHAADDHAQQHDRPERPQLLAQVVVEAAVAVGAEPDVRVVPVVGRRRIRAAARTPARATAGQAAPTP